MGSKTSPKSNPTKARSSTSKHNSKKNVAVKHSAKRVHQRVSRDQSERVRDALNRDVGLLYHAFENAPRAPSSVPRPDSVVSLAECMRGLGR